MGKKVTITLTVEASALYAMTDPTQAQVEVKCSLSDDNEGSSPDGNIEHFMSNVYLDNDVKWQGATSDAGYTVAIKSIDYEPNVNNDVNFFDETSIVGTGGRNGTVKHKVKNDTSLDGKIDVYTIQFRVYASGNDWKPFHIDPKLKANPKN